MCHFYWLHNGNKYYTNRWSSKNWCSNACVVISSTLIEYNDAYSKISGSLWQCYRDEPVLDNNGGIIDFPDNNNSSASFKFKEQITGQTGKTVAQKILK